VVTRAASLFDERYVAWAAGALPEGAVAPAARDAALVGALLATTPGAHRLQGLLRAHADVEELVRAAARDLPGEALERLTADRPELVELVRCAAALAAPDYAEAWRGLGLAAGESGVRAALEGAGLACLADVRVLLSHPLGVRGRGFGDAVIVGAPTDWCGLGAGDVAARALHEIAVGIASARSSGDAARRWAEAEAVALEALARRLRGTPLARAHAAFVASLDLSALAAPDASSVDAVLAEL
jgi:hypothetical protein